MNKTVIYILVAVVAIIAVVVGSGKFTGKSSLTVNEAGSNQCSKYSNKDGYTGCQSVVKGKEKLCKFKVDNKVNESTQQMEFTYTCSPK
ncbi:MAG: hypothetical protein WAV40_04410 [Microgenomates group bacterium]